MYVCPDLYIFYRSILSVFAFSLHDTRCYVRRTRRFINTRALISQVLLSSIWPRAQVIIILAQECFTNLCPVLYWLIDTHTRNSSCSNTRRLDSVLGRRRRRKESCGSPRCRKRSACFTKLSSCFTFTHAHVVVYTHWPPRYMSAAALKRARVAACKNHFRCLWAEAAVKCVFSFGNYRTHDGGVSRFFFFTAGNALWQH